MDSEGNCLVLSPCFSCKQAKNGVQVCLARKHNARLTAVKVDDLTSRHRMCVKPDQSMTIFKLVDRETGEESVEYAKDMVFQRPCDGCQHLKSCIMAGHPLQDWAAEGNDNRIVKRKSMSSTPKSPKSPGVSSPVKSQGSSSRGKTAAASAGSAEAVASPLAAAMKGRNAAGNHRPKRRKTDTGMVSSSATAPAATEPKTNVGINAVGKGAGSRSAAGSRSVASSRSTPGRGGAAGAAGTVSGGGGGAVTTAQTIAERLQEMTAAEELLRQQFQTDMQNLDKAEVSKLKEIEEAKAALERIRLIRKATRDKIEEQRKDMSAERQRLTHLRVKAIIREEEELRRRNEALWTACEASAGLPLGSRSSPAAAASAREEHGRPARAARAGRSSARQVHPTLPVLAPGVAAAAPTSNGCSSSSSVSLAQDELEVAAAAAGGATAGGYHVINPWSASGREIGGGRGNDDDADSEGTEEGDINVEGGGTHEEGTRRGGGNGLTGGEADFVSGADLEEGLTQGVGSSEDSGGREVGARPTAEQPAETRAMNESGSIPSGDEDENGVPAEAEMATEEEKGEEEAATTKETGTLCAPEENGGPSRDTHGKRDGDGEAEGRGGLVGNVGVAAEREENEAEIRGGAEDAPSEAFGVAGPGRTDNGGGSEATRGRSSDSSNSSSGSSGKRAAALQQALPSGGAPAERDEQEGVDGDVGCEDEEERVDVGGSPVGGGIGGEGATR